jgi:hypothetical protein
MAAFRGTKRASKQYLFLLVENFLRKGGQYDTALDLACGYMAFADVIPAKRYVGVDTDAERLREGQAAHPDAKAVNARLEELAPNISGDIVLCLQCIGVNKYFDNRKTLEVVDRIIAATRLGGDLAFNVGPYSLSHFDEIDGKVKAAYEDCRIYDYGRFHEFFAKKKGLSASMALAYLMWALPPLARNPARPKRLYLCRGRRLAKEMAASL